MAPRHFPESPEFQSTAEREMFHLILSQLPDDAVLFHGLRLIDRAQDREADLVVAIPGAGVAVIEVKGGHISLDDGVWRQTSRSGSGVVDPVGQARSCRYLLRTYLQNHPGWPHGWPRMVHLVAFPYTELPVDFSAPDCPRWMMIGAGDRGRAVPLILDALRMAERQADPPDAAMIEDLVECLAGRKIPQQDLVAAALERDYFCEALTRAQAAVLDHISLLKRVEIRGGAGSGKTWLAIEQARRWAAQGKRVALVCYSRGLATYLQRRVELFLPKEQLAYVGTFHGVGTDLWGLGAAGDEDSDYWETTLPRAMSELSASLTPADKFDAIVVDEAQDFADSWWPALESCLVDGPDATLVVFSDDAQRVFAREGRPSVELLPIPLDENLRNTKQIAQTFGSLTAGQMKYRGGDGDPVRFVACPEEPTAAVEAASDAAVALLDLGWAPQHVALLTTGNRHPLQVEQQARGQDRYWASYWQDEDLFYGHVLGFKGLERPAVVLAVNGFRDPDRAREMLYVGLSRARDLLIVCGDPAVIRQVGGVAVAKRLGID